MVSYRLSIVTIALPLTNRPQFASDAQVNRGWITFGQNMGRKGSTDVSQILTLSGRDVGLSYDRNSVDIFCQLTTMHKSDRQTDRQTDHGTVTLISTGKIAAGVGKVETG